MFRGGIKSGLESTVTAHYSCTACGLSGVDISVAAKREDQGHMDWAVKTIYPVAQVDHLKRSARCANVFLDIGVRPADYVPPALIVTH